MSKKEITHKVEYLKSLTGLNLYADYASCYGGWRLVIIDDHMGESGCLDTVIYSPRIRSKEFTTFLDGIIAGIVCQLKVDDLKHAVTQR